MKLLNLIFIGFICVSICLQSCMRMRWRDEKAIAVFRHQNAPLAIFDTVIANRHIHYALSSDSDTLPVLVFMLSM